MSTIYRFPALAKEGQESGSFFEKKNQKTFYMLRGLAGESATAIGNVFASFFIKKRLPCLPYQLFAYEVSDCIRATTLRSA
jgi:hypothetical protein